MEQNKEEFGEKKWFFRQQIFPMILMFVGISLVIFGAFLIISSMSSGVAKNSKISEIVTDQPVHIIHEMEPFDPNSIPYLPQGGPQPHIYASESFYNFGKVNASEIVQHEFVIYNDGEAPLTISRAYTTCGCTTADLSATIIPPGKAARLTLVFDAGFHKEAAGTTVRRGVVIENNDPNNSQFEIWTQASVRAEN
ncbi:MAG: hypothetical protein CL609_15490 [Anaerolineaceae bacterium]|nr:hypothetical protein [Anaerolineaceae bacterium]